jgi:cation diffusion facilitator family transporter
VNTPAPQNSTINGLPIKQKKPWTAETIFWQTLLANIVTSSSKLIVGSATHTLSMVADGFHSLLDATSNVVGILALRFSGRPPDARHPYGHRKLEAIAAMAISGFLFMASYQIMESAVSRWFSPSPVHPQISLWSLAVVLGNMAISLGVSHYETYWGKRLKQSLLIADAQHTMTDVYALIAVLGVMVAVYFKQYWADGVVAVVIVCLILRAGYQILMTHMGVLLDQTVMDPPQVAAIVNQVPGVLGCHKIRSRGLPDAAFLDLHIQVAPELTIRDAHQISHAVERALLSHFDGKVYEVLVHIEDTIHDEGD